MPDKTCRCILPKVPSCTGPDAAPMVLKRRSEAVPPEVVRTIDALQIRGR